MMTIHYKLIYLLKIKNYHFKSKASLKKNFNKLDCLHTLSSPGMNMNSSRAQLDNNIGLALVTSTWINANIEKRDVMINTKETAGFVLKMKLNSVLNVCKPLLLLKSNRGR